MQKASSGFRTPLQQLFLLEERVRLAGVYLPEEADQASYFHGIKCVIGNKHCVINLRNVAEVLDEKLVTPVPLAARFIEGVMNYRGTLVPVYRPQVYLGLDDSTPRGPLIVIRKDKKGLEFFAIRANTMLGMQKFNVNELQPVSGSDGNSAALDAFVSGVITAKDHVWCCLDIAQLLNTINASSPRQSTITRVHA